MSKYKSVVFFIIYICIICFSFEGCNALHQDKKSLNNFDERIKLYGRLLRWEEYEGALNMIRHKDESPVNVNLDDFEDLRITDYEIKKVALDTEYKSAVVEAEITYYFETTNAIKSIRDIQTWWYFEDSEIWFLDSGLPKF